MSLQQMQPLSFANLARAHWEKLVWNIHFNGLGVASAAADLIRSDDSW